MDSGIDGVRDSDALKVLIIVVYGQKEKRGTDRVGCLF